MNRRSGAAMRVAGFWLVGCCVAVGVAWAVDLARSWRGPFARVGDGRAFVNIDRESATWAPPERACCDGIEGARVFVGWGFTAQVLDEHPAHSSGEEASILAGWPLRCVRREEWCGANGLWDDYDDRHLSIWERGVTVWPRSAWSLTEPTRRDLVPERRFALRPVWIGLALDGAWFGMFAWGLGRGVRELRLWKRGRARLCERCAYDRAGLDRAIPCPECGTAAISRP